MIKLIIFDMDGVLVDSEAIHLQAYQKTFETIPKNQLKIQPEKFAQLFQSDQGLNAGQVFQNVLVPEITPNQLRQIKALKQKITRQLLLAPATAHRPNPRIIKILANLKTNYPDLQIYVASNSNWKTVHLTLSQMGYLPYLDYILTGSEVKSPKPSPDIYYACMTRAQTSPKETLILEDSPTGLAAAYQSGAHVITVKNPHTWTEAEILQTITQTSSHHLSSPSQIPFTLTPHSPFSHYSIADFFDSSYHKLYIVCHFIATYLQNVSKKLISRPKKGPYFGLGQD